MIFGRQEDSHELYQVLLLSMAQEMTPPNASPNATVQPSMRAGGLGCVDISCRWQRRR